MCLYVEFRTHTVGEMADDMDEIINCTTNGIHAPDMSQSVIITSVCNSSITNRFQMLVRPRKINENFIYVTQSVDMKANITVQSTGNNSEYQVVVLPIMDDEGIVLPRMKFRKSMNVPVVPALTATTPGITFH